MSAIQLSFVFSEYYDANGHNPDACSFAGNGTVNAEAPSSVSAANTAASSCLSNPSATFTPTTPATNNPGPPTQVKKSGATAAFADVGVFVGLAFALATGMGSAIWTLFPVL